MVRRLLLTCAVLMCKDLAQTTVFIVITAVITLVIEQETKPYCASFLSAYCNVCCWQVVLFTLYLLLLDAEMTTGGQAIAISALLMVRPNPYPHPYPNPHPHPNPNPNPT